MMALMTVQGSKGNVSHVILVSSPPTTSLLSTHDHRCSP